MNIHKAVKMSLVKTGTIKDLVRDDLSALQIMKRSTVASPLHLCAVGDIRLSGRVAVSLISPIGSDAIIAEVAPDLRKADISFGNLETSRFPSTYPQRINDIYYRDRIRAIVCL